MGLVAGAIGGSQKDVVDESSSQSIQLGSKMQGQQAGADLQDKSIQNLTSLTGLGPGAQDVTNAQNNNQSFARMLQQYSQTGGAPSAQMQQAASQYAQSQLAPTFRQQNIDAQRQAGILGRPVDDPVLQAKLRLGQSEQTNQFASQYANQLSQNAIGFAGQQNQLLNGLASQAFQNQATLLGFGNAVATQGMNWQLNTGTRSGTGTQSSGGGLKGAIEGGMAGQAMDIKNMQSIMSMAGSGAAMCDRNVKTDVRSAEREVGDMFAGLPAYEFRYKPETEIGDGLYYGPMAQDLEKHPVGKSCVIETPKGKAIDITKLVPAIIAHASTVERRLRALETKHDWKGVK